MNIDEAKKLATAWTIGIAENDGGWMEVLRVMLLHVKCLEAQLGNAHSHNHKLRDEVQRLSLDLGIKNTDFVLPPQQWMEDCAKKLSDINEGQEFK